MNVYIHVYICIERRSSGAIDVYSTVRSGPSRKELPTTSPHIRSSFKFQTSYQTISVLLTKSGLVEHYVNDKIAVLVVSLSDQNQNGNAMQKYVQRFEYSFLIRYCTPPLYPKRKRPDTVECEHLGTARLMM